MAAVLVMKQATAGHHRSFIVVLATGVVAVVLTSLWVLPKFWSLLGHPA